LVDRPGQDHHRYEWTYLYSFMRPKTGKVHWLILPTTVNAEMFSMALSHFAEQVGAGKDKRILLVLDGAGWHTVPRVQVAEGLYLEFLPSHSPELQPSERLISSYDVGASKVASPASRAASMSSQRTSPEPLRKLTVTPL
jgi:hypothetical protein